MHGSIPSEFLKRSKESKDGKKLSYKLKVKYIENPIAVGRDEVIRIRKSLAFQKTGR